MSRTKSHGKVHRNFKLTDQVDKALRQRAKRLQTTQTAVLEAAVLGTVPVSKEDSGLIKLSERAQRLLLKAAVNRHSSPISILDALVIEKLS